MKTLQEVECEHVMNVLQYVNNDRSKAAKILGVSRGLLYRRLKAYGRVKHFLSKRGDCELTNL